MGPKTSCVTYVEDGRLQSSVKVSGLNLKGEVAANVVSARVYNQHVADFLSNIENKLKGAYEIEAGDLGI